MTNMEKLRTLLLVALGALLIGMGIARGQEADLLPALLALDQAPHEPVATTGRKPTAPVSGSSRVHDPAAGAGSIHWVTPAEAKASPLPDYWCVTKEDGSCPPCLRLKGLLADARVVAWSRHYDCVKSDRLDGKLPAGYPVQRWGKRVREGVLPGYGVNDLMWDFAGKAKPAAVKVAAVRQGYPVRGSWWSHPSDIHSHLLSSEHAGKWSAAWVRSLSRSEAESLHSDDHEGRVKWSYVVRP